MSSSWTVGGRRLRETVGLSKAGQDREAEQWLDRLKEVETTAQRLKKALSYLLREIAAGPQAGEKGVFEVFMDIGRSAPETSREHFDSLARACEQRDQVLPKRLTTALEKAGIAYVNAWLEEVGAAKSLHSDFETARVKRDHYRDKVASLQEGIRVSEARNRVVSAKERERASRNEEKLQGAENEYQAARRVFIGGATHVWLHRHARADVLLLRYMQLERTKIHNAAKAMDEHLSRAESELLRAAKSAGGGIASPPSATLPSLDSTGDEESGAGKPANPFASEAGAAKPSNPFAGASAPEDTGGSPRGEDVEGEKKPKKKKSSKKKKKASPLNPFAGAVAGGATSGHEDPFAGDDGDNDNSPVDPFGGPVDETSQKKSTNHIATSSSFDDFGDSSPFDDHKSPFGDDDTPAHTDPFDDAAPAAGKEPDPFFEGEDTSKSDHPFPSSDSTSKPEPFFEGGTASKPAPPASSSDPFHGTELESGDPFDGPSKPQETMFGSAAPAPGESDPFGSPSAVETVPASSDPFGAAEDAPWGDPEPSNPDKTPNPNSGGGDDDDDDPFFGL